MGDGAALLTRHVFLDLETTGLDPRVDEVIELGALFVEDGREVGRLSRLFRPSRPLPPLIRQLTGLSDAALAHAPPFAGALEGLREALRGWTVVAHNAAFEAGFLPGMLGHLGAPVLDSCELLHYLHPELESHSLSSLKAWAGLGARTCHRALLDCQTTLAVVAHALGRCIREGRGEDVADLRATLDAGGGGEAAPLVALLGRLEAACGAASPGAPAGQRAPPEATRVEPAMDHAARAPRAYLRALARRCPDGDIRRASRWFRSRFPALEALVTAVSAAPPALAAPPAAAAPLLATAPGHTDDAATWPLEPAPAALRPG